MAFESPRHRRTSKIALITALVLFLFFLVSGVSGNKGFQEWLRAAFPKAARQVDATHGLSPYQSPGHKSPGKKPGRAVILIHGLDEPGRVWLNLAPALDRHGFSVWRFTYPNDQDIRVSARYLFRELEAREWGTKASVDLVVHSMGGLVAREMLTAPDIGYDQAAGEGRVPAVSRLIMVGTPNLGASLARFRLVMEIREQILNRIHGHGSWLQGFLDGSGEAADQLLPGSDFLSRLNARPYPNGVSMTVIAGIICPWLPPGDGLVSVTSARLEKIPFYTVPGNHLTMVRNLWPKSKRTPPAVPLILRLLER